MQAGALVVCRGCLMTGRSKEMKPLTGAIRNIFSKCNSIEILTEDPQQICFHCFRQITTWASFRIMVQKKNIEFRRMQQASSLQWKLEDSVSVKGEPEEVVPADVSEGDRVMDPKDSDEENMLVKKEENSADQEDDSGMGSFEMDSTKEFDVKLEPSDEHEDTWSEVKVELNSSIDEFLCGFQLESEAEEEEDQLEIENPDEVAEPSMDWDVSDDEPLLNQDLVTTKEPTVDMTCGPSTSKAKKKLSKDGKIQCPICYQQDLPKQMYQHMKRRHVKDEKKCPLCAKEFRNVTSHMLRTHCINWACDLCFYFRTASTAVMDKHVQNKHPFLNVEACPICKKAVEGFTGFCHHLRGHLDQNYYCPICNQDWGSIEGTAAHIVEDHVMSGLSFPQLKINGAIKCVRCQKTFATPAEYSKHSHNEDANVQMRYNSQSGSGPRVEISRPNFLKITY